MVLDNLKDVWKNQKESTLTFSESDIYKMIHKKSTSIVKWIFYISVIEFVLLMFPNFFMTVENIEELHISKYINISIIFSVIIGVVFIYLFYKNYKNICVSDSTKKLMENILKTRKTVKNYIAIQLLVAAFVLLLTMYSMTNSEDFLAQLPENFNTLTLWLIIIFMVAIILGVIWLFYKLLYGILLHRLNINYKELAQKD